MEGKKNDYGIQLWNKAVSGWQRGTDHLWQLNEQCETKFLWIQIVLNASWAPDTGAQSSKNQQPSAQFRLFICVACCPDWKRSMMELTSCKVEYVDQLQERETQRSAMTELFRQHCVHNVPHHYEGHLLCFWMLNQQCGCLSTSPSLLWL